MEVLKERSVHLRTDRNIIDYPLDDISAKQKRQLEQRQEREEKKANEKNMFDELIASSDDELTLSAASTIRNKQTREHNKF